MKTGKALAENPAYCTNLCALDVIFAHASPRKVISVRTEPLTEDKVLMLRQQAAIWHCPIWMIGDDQGIEEGVIREIVTGKTHREADGPICMRYPWYRIMR